MVRVAKGSFHRLEQVFESLTADRLKKAGAEMRETKTTSDPDISLLLRELSIFGHAQPLSNESRLLMRKKIQALIGWTGMPAVWITINPNDINNPVKIRLSIHRLHDYDTACDLLADLHNSYERIALSIMDPVSAAIFFHREVSSSSTNMSGQARSQFLARLAITMQRWRQTNEAVCTCMGSFG
ncbi:hypothetical protein MAA_11732 [Metarhizium robertsii ARSEF 23]|uniref:Helitron helicase-like domain-containing protein n=1 Tax=Metarhizium robertsii (strain ARSEF 23 / ATCC MYA-3075) TaxID=655844 RepID=A0A0B2XFI8_METRA|nr:uncharacterized protein MAA_11732 [Metarhizium robertsii ARSEF 23]KHO10681.1 hypothetical protein MAA_11732 [Metarhizium robertsii ARSEF 23]